MTDRGTMLLAEARALLQKFRADPDHATTEQIDALRATARSAMNWLEDTPDFEQAHLVLDAAGELIRRVRPGACVFAFENDTYFRTCSVDLAHNRVGLSPAFVIRESECSACHLDPWDPECFHEFGEEYDGEIAHLVITRADMIEASLVSRPRQPDARLLRVSLDLEDLPSEASRRWGEEIVCGLCLAPCAGVSDSFDSDIARLAEDQSSASEPGPSSGDGPSSISTVK